MSTFDRFEKVATWIAAAFFFALLAGMAFAQPPARKAATVGERMLSLGLATVNDAGEVVAAPREQVVAWIADLDGNIAELEAKVAKMRAARNWVAGTVLPAYPTPTPTPAPSATPAG
jgi:hypothetical protein